MFRFFSSSKKILSIILISSLAVAQCHSSDVEYEEHKMSQKVKKGILATVCALSVAGLWHAAKNTDSEYFPFLFLGSLVTGIFSFGELVGSGRGEYSEVEACGCGGAHCCSPFCDHHQFDPSCNCVDCSPFDYEECSCCFSSPHQAAYHQVEETHTTVIQDYSEVNVENYHHHCGGCCGHNHDAHHHDAHKEVVHVEHADVVVNTSECDFSAQPEEIMARFII